MNIVKKILKWFFISLAVLYFGVVVYRGFVIHNERKTAVVVEKIHNTKLTMDDVLGKSLPPDPGTEAGKTVAGIDANLNGIRDDVELAIFKEYPNSEKKRAVSLQYALALQMEFTQPFVNTDIVIAVIQEEGRADTCLSDELVPRKTPESARVYGDLEKIDVFIKFVEKNQFNTDMRREARENFYEKIGSFSSLNDYCDIDTTKLLN